MHEPDRRPCLDCDEVRARHPRLLTACITPFGRTGPYSHYRADDLVLSALSGLADATPGFPDRQENAGEPPVQSLAPLAEVGAGLVAGIAVFGSLLQRLRGSERPAHVEVSALEANAWLMVSEWGIAAYGGTAPGRRRKSRTLEPNCYLPCRDGHLVIVATTDRHWSALVEAMGNPTWASDARFQDVAGRAAHAEALHAHLREWATDVSGREFMERAQARRVPCACFFELGDVVGGEQVRSCGSVEEIGGRALPADPVVVNGIRRRRGDAPRLAAVEVGAHSSGAPEAPLSGVRVLDLGQMVAGPMAGQLLAALGADVVVVESRRRLTSRSFGPFAGEPTYDASSNFNHCNRGKRSVAVDLSTDDGRRILYELVAASDVVLENFSRHAAEKLGLTYAELRIHRADVILASISAFGREGPLGGYVSHHGGVAALSGIASVTRDAQGGPRLVGAIYPDVLTGAYTSLAILQAVAERARTGAGCHVELSMLDVLLTTMAGLVPDATGGQRFGPHPAPFLASAEPHRFLAVAAADAVAHADAVAGVSGRTRRDAMSALQERGIRAAAVLDMLEVMDDPHLRERGFVLELEHAVAGRKPLPGVPWLYDGARPPLGVAPLLGDASNEVLAGLAGLEHKHVEDLRHEGVLA
jgi:crotonobetainyl-CoA:carnitine CoA-transferase CaiB-like acyl-CoA transferase